ncbi:MAG: hypothetical protein ACE5I7_18780 [Candidatus Binatia bacterium]
MDGDVTDWAGVPQSATDDLDDSTNNDPAEDMKGGFVDDDGTNMYFRIDVGAILCQGCSELCYDLALVERKAVLGTPPPADACSVALPTCTTDSDCTFPDTCQDCGIFVGRCSTPPKAPIEYSVTYELQPLLDPMGTPVCSPLPELAEVAIEFQTDNTLASVPFSASKSSTSVNNWWTRSYKWHCAAPAQCPWGVVFTADIGVTYVTGDRFTITFLVVRDKADMIELASNAAARDHVELYYLDVAQPGRYAYKEDNPPLSDKVVSPPTPMTEIVTGLQTTFAQDGTTTTVLDPFRPLEATCIPCTWP